jgi:hypothetical protein
VINALSYARRSLRKIREWTARYLPAEIIGSTSAVTCAFIVFHQTGERSASAIAGTLAENVGFYAVMFGTEWWRQRRVARAGFLLTAWGTLRVMLAEFGPAEVVDSLMLRPLSMYAGPFVTGEIASGSLLGKLLADAAFYLLAIASYEIAQSRARSRGGPVGATGRYAGAAHGPGTGGSGPSGDGRGVAWDQLALRHEVQPVPASADPVELPRMPVRGRVHYRAL